MPPPSVHPDDERLSAAFDGQDREAAAHAETCPSCGARLAAFAAVARTLGVAPAVPTARRDSDIAAALAAASRAEPDVVPITRSSRRNLGLALGAAAAVLAAVLAGAVLMRDEDRPLDSAAEESAQRAGVELSGDLGDVADDTALRDALAGALDETAATMAAPAEDGVADSGGGGESAPAASASALVLTGPAPCVAEADELGGDSHGELLRAVALRYQGTPATAIVFQIDTGDGDRLRRRAYVMANEGCRLLVVQSF